MTTPSVESLRKELSEAQAALAATKKEYHLNPKGCDLSADIAALGVKCEALTAAIAQVEENDRKAAEFLNSKEYRQTLKRIEVIEGEFSKKSEEYIVEAYRLLAKVQALSKLDGEWQQLRRYVGTKNWMDRHLKTGRYEELTQLQMGLEGAHRAGQFYRAAREAIQNHRKKSTTPNAKRKDPHYIKAGDVPERYSVSD